MIGSVRVRPLPRMALVAFIVMLSTAVVPAVVAASIPGNWYLARDHAGDAQIELPATLSPVRVAVLDSGIDGGHPALAGAIVAARGFLGGNPLVDTEGHGTFVAGEIVSLADAAAANADRPSPVQLLIAKITNGTVIDPAVEAQAIEWAVRNGARVINLSFGAPRNPTALGRDSYSPIEAAAVRDAIAHRVTVVAAVGNSESSPSTPWQYADWPAALPHVIGVSALDPDGSVPIWSNRDSRFDQLAAPGTMIVSAFPRNLTSADPSCADQGYSDCGSAEYRLAEGTSFAAPQVAAAAALLLSVDPQLTPDQVSWLLERNADDVDPATGCAACAVGRDPLTGWGALDVARAIAALAGPLPPANSYEPTNDAGDQAHPLTAAHAVISGDLDFWENPVDVYRIQLRRGQPLWLRLSAQSGSATLALWKPGTEHVQVPATLVRRERLLAAASGSPLKELGYRARRAGWYYVEIDLRTPTNASYTLSYAEGT